MNVARLGPRRAPRLAFAGLIAAVVTACSGAPATPDPSATSFASAAPTQTHETASPRTIATPAAPATSTAAPATAFTGRVEVSLTDTMRIEPGVLAVPAGQPVTFVVTNAGVLEHEFFLGDEAAQAEHAEEMAGMDVMPHDDKMGIGVAPGETRELTVAFTEPGTILAGCHIPGHYAAGMKAVVEING